MRDVVLGLCAMGLGALWLALLFWLALHRPPLVAYALAVAPLLLVTGAILAVQERRRRRHRARLLEQEMR